MNEGPSQIPRQLAWEVSSRRRKRRVNSTRLGKSIMESSRIVVPTRERRCRAGQEAEIWRRLICGRKRLIDYLLLSLFFSPTPT